MGDVGIDDEEVRAVGVEGDVFDLAAPTVDAKGVVGPAEGVGELVHDATGHPHLLVLRPVAGVGECLRRQVEAVGGVQRTTDRDLQGGRRGEARAHDHVAADGDIGAERPADVAREDVGSPDDVRRPTVPSLATAASTPSSIRRE